VAHLHQYSIKRAQDTSPEAIWQHAIRTARRQRAGARYL
jgi:hypothetical protein